MNEAQRRRAGRAIADRIAACGLTAAQVADLVDVSPRTVQRILRGERWPSDPLQATIERILDWPDGQIAIEAALADRAGMLSRFTSLELVAELHARLRDA